MNGKRLTDFGESWVATMTILENCATSITLLTLDWVAHTSRF